MVLESRPVQRVIRFLSGSRVLLGEQPMVGEACATVLEGDMLNPPSLHRTSEVARVEKLLAPLQPPQVLCIGMNYAKHFEESGQGRGVPLPEKPAMFVKSPSSVNDPDAAVWIPRVPHGEQFDYEVELAVVIGRPCRNATKESALSYVAGYTIGNDFTARHWQFNAGASQWNKGKSFDTLCPLGPVFVTSDAVKDPQNLQLSCSVNGEMRQNSTTRDMIHGVAEIIEWLSADMTILPGTVILTGTPEGVAAGMKEPKWLKPGDIVEATIQGIGTLRNVITEPPSHL